MVPVIVESRSERLRKILVRSTRTSEFYPVVLDRGSLSGHSPLASRLHTKIVLRLQLSAIRELSYPHKLLHS